MVPRPGPSVVVAMTPRVRKAALVAHVASSVGWLGAAASGLVLAVAGMTADDETSVRAVYISLEAIGWYALVPLSFASLVTGILQATGTTWGLVRHYWVLVKLVLTAFATAVLLLYMETLTALADVARDPALPIWAGGALPSFSPVLHAGAALAVLATALVLSIYKPKGITGFGRTRPS
jgi:hypothetical protein